MPTDQHTNIPAGTFRTQERFLQKVLASRENSSSHYGQTAVGFPVRQDGFRSAPSTHPSRERKREREQSLWFLMWRMPWNRLGPTVAMSLKRQGQGTGALGLLTLLRIPQSCGDFCGFLPHPRFLSYSKQLSLCLASSPENSFVGIGGPHQRELGGSPLSKHLTAAGASFSFLLPVIPQTRGLLITESRLEWSFYLEPFTKGIAFRLPLKK